MRIVQIGGGHMGGALLERWASELDWTFTLVDPGQPSVPRKVAHVSTMEPLIGADFDALIVAVKPQIIDEALRGAAHCLKPGAVAVSIAAGTPLQRLTELLGARPAIRAMPNLPVSVGMGMTGLCANELCTDQNRQWASDLFRPTGEVLWLDHEDGIDRFTAIAGSGPGYIFEMLRSYVAASTALGFSENDAAKLAMQTVRGTLALVDQKDQSLSAWRDRVTSKHGTTEAGLNVFRAADGFEHLFRRGTQAAYARAQELRA